MHDFIVINLELRKIRLKWVLDRVDAVYSALPIMHEKTWRFSQLFLPENSRFILNQFGENINLFRRVFLSIRSDKVNIDIAWLRRSLLFLEWTINQSTVSFSTMVCTIVVMDWHHYDILNFKLADEFPVLAWGLDELDPSTEMSLEKGVITQHCIALIPIIHSLIQ